MAVPGCHVVEYTLLVLSPGNAAGGSPFEKLATTEPFDTGCPQSSFSSTVSEAGHPAGTAKLFESAVWVIITRLGVQPTAWGTSPPYHPHSGR